MSFSLINLVTHALFVYTIEAFLVLEKCSLLVLATTAKKWGWRTLIRFLRWGC